MTTKLGSVQYTISLRRAAGTIPFVVERETRQGVIGPYGTFMPRQATYSARAVTIPSKDHKATSSTRIRRAVMKLLQIGEDPIHGHIVPVGLGGTIAGGVPCHSVEFELVLGCRARFIVRHEIKLEYHIFHLDVLFSSKARQRHHDVHVVAVLKGFEHELVSLLVALHHLCVLWRAMLLVTWPVRLLAIFATVCEGKRRNECDAKK